MKKIGIIALLVLFFSGVVYADTISVMGFKALPQEEQNWCWAASIQSIFLTKGLNVTQSKIVTAAYWKPINKTAPGFDGTLKILNGLAFSADGSAWKVNASAWNRFPDANWLYLELKNNKPIMIWYKDNYSNHSIVINGGRYIKDANGNVNWQQISAYDPWKNSNIVIDAANIPRYVYGSFAIELQKLNVESTDSEPSEKHDMTNQTTPYGYKVPEWMK